MIFPIISVAVPLAVYFSLPRLLGYNKQANKALLAVGCFIFFISWYLPSPDIHGQDTSAVTHFVGGGLFTGFVWLYSKQTLNWCSNLFVEALSLFALVSMLGVMNELFELFLHEAGIVSFALEDTPWDLLMNTLGATLFFVTYKVVSKLHR